MIRAVLDTNIWISAIHFGGTPEQIVRLTLKKRFISITSPFILHEVQEVLVKKFRYTVRESLFIQNRIQALCRVVYPTTTVSVLPDNLADNKVLECVEASKANYLVSGDKKHLLPLGSFKKTKIVDARVFYDVLAKRS
jgi:uncharacterized protein